MKIPSWLRPSADDLEVEIPPVQLEATSGLFRSLGCALIWAAVILGAAVVWAATSIPTFYVVQHVGRCP